MHSDWEDIGVTEAKAYLENADTKRPVTPATVDMYARDMEDRAWFPTHQGIAFATVNGKQVLKDGGHRMRAVVLADSRSPGTTVKIWVTRGVDPAAYEGFDIGRGRTNANMVQAWFPDMKNSKDVASVARRAIAYTSGRPWTKVQSSKHELHNFIESHPTVISSAEYARNWKLPRATISASTAGFAHWVLTHISADEGREFMDQVRTGAGLQEGSPVLVLRNRLMSTSDSRYLAYSLKARGREPEITVALVVMAWNKWREHAAIAKLQLPSVLADETFPVPRELISWKDPRGLLKD